MEALALSKKLRRLEANQNHNINLRAKQSEIRNTV